jgi:hypothetical protein
MSGNCYPGHLFLIARRILHRITLRLPNKRGQLRARLSELGCRLNRVKTTDKNGRDAFEMGCLFYPPRADIGRRQPFSRNRSGKTKGGGLDGLRTRKAYRRGQGRCRVIVRIGMTNHRLRNGIRVRHRTYRLVVCKCCLRTSPSCKICVRVEP